MINEKRLKYINSLGRTREANCWGSTQYVLNVISKPIWQDEQPMNDFLKNNTSKITKPKIGDILVLRGRRELVHTAVYIGKGKWWHKPGPQAAEFATEKRVVEMYNDYATRVEYRRFTNTRMTRRKKLAPVPFVPAKEKFLYKIYRMFLKLANIK